jgi:eukaryotic-like serine/threonine-protein kinase
MPGLSDSRSERYKGTYERGGGLPFAGPSAQRDQTIQQARDLRCGIDYLETRRDIDRDRLAFYGFSFGARLGPIFTALEPRFKASVLMAGGFPSPHQPPEVDEVHFAPRAKVPVLMLNGRYDFLFPLEASQNPMFRLLGAPEKDKRHVLLDSGHFPYPMHAAIKEILDWLDRYLGPAQTK